MPPPKIRWVAKRCETGRRRLRRVALNAVSRLGDARSRGGWHWWLVHQCLEQRLNHRPVPSPERTMLAPTAAKKSCGTLVGKPPVPPGCGSVSCAVLHSCMNERDHIAYRS
jgi:hypothetical protein